MDEMTLRGLLAGQGLPVDAMRRENLPAGEALYWVPVSRTGALDIWRHLRQAVDQTGFWPLLTHGIDEFSRDDLEGGRTANTVIAASMDINPVTWIEQQERENAAWMTENGFDSEDEAVEEGPWPDDAEPNNSFYFPHDSYSSSQRPQRLLRYLVPTTEP